MPGQTRNQIAFQFPDLDAPGIERLADLVREATRALFLEGINGPYTVTITVKGRS